jgi:thiamine biosynthesis protein ThiS
MQVLGLCNEQAITHVSNAQLWSARNSGYPPPVPTIQLNGDEHRTDERATIAQLLEQLNLDPRQVAVERNREIVPRATYDETVLADGDRLEIVTFVGGG